MAPQGRKPKSIEARILEGNPGKRPIPQPVKLPGAVVTAETFKEPPEELPESAKAWWRKAVPVLAQVGILETVDEAALELMATQYARAKQAARIISQQGIVSRGAAGHVVEHPLLATERAAMAAFLRLAEQYALTPVARTKLGLAELQRRSLQEEIQHGLGRPTLEAVEG